MIEIRTIRESEAEEFLDLLCSVFNLDRHRARGIFFTEPLFDLRRKWALFEGGQMISILTTSPLLFGWGRAFGVAGVATRLDLRGMGYAGKLLSFVFERSCEMGETAALLFAREQGLYSRAGFEVVDRVVRGPIDCSDEPLEPDSMEHSQVRSRYGEWATKDPNRLLRDETRWKYWNWHFRICTPFQDGYLCAEPGTLREAVYLGSYPSLPLPPQTDWFGTRTMTEELQIPLSAPPTEELFFMARGFPGVPRLFMTDQF